MNKISPGKITAKKRFGQNFLIDKGVVDDIVCIAGVGDADTVLEIGPGTGTLTRALAKSAGRVIAVEIDPELTALLKEELSGLKNLSIVEGDILKTDLRELFSQEESVKVVANLPYYITTPVIMYLLDETLPIESITLMVQKEVSQRLTASPGTKAYGALTLAAAYRARVSMQREVSADCFRPRPKVDSAIVRFDIYSSPPAMVRDPEHMFCLIRAAFGERRKTLANALSNAPGLNIKRESVEEALKDMGLRTDIRGERLSLGEFAELSGRLIKRG